MGKEKGDRKIKVFVIQAEGEHRWIFLVGDANGVWCVSYIARRDLLNWKKREGVKNDH